jgi:hypothetical protein
MKIVTQNRMASVRYFGNEANALLNKNLLTTGDTKVSAIGGYSSWRIALNSSGLSPANRVYEVGDILNPLQSDGSAATYYLYPAIKEFVFDSPQIQAAANTVYQYKAAYDEAEAGRSQRTGRPQQVYNFKTDWERMQYKLGNFGLFSRGLAPG